MSDYAFFDNWSILDEAIANNQETFCNKYMKFNSGAQSQLRTKTYVTAAMYGNINILKKFKESNCYDFDNGLHLAIENSQYNIVKWFMKCFIESRSEFERQHYWRRPLYGAWTRIYKGANILGTAIASCGDFEMIKMIIEWNESLGVNLHTISRFKQFDVDNFVWNGQTAIQTAFLFCNDNYELLKYLLNKHDPNYKDCILSNMLSDDVNYIKYKRIITHNSRGEKIVIGCSTKEGLKGSISLKPDCEGYTIADRIKLCKKLNQLTQSQCDSLEKLFNDKIALLHSDE